MRTRTSTWFECKIRYDKMMEDGMQKKITELYVVDAGDRAGKVGDGIAFAFAIGRDRGRCHEDGGHQQRGFAGGASQALQYGCCLNHRNRKGPGPIRGDWPKSVF